MNVPWVVSRDRVLILRGYLKHAKFAGLRDDKDPRKVINQKKSSPQPVTSSMLR